MFPCFVVDDDDVNVETDRVGNDTYDGVRSVPSWDRHVISHRDLSNTMPVVWTMVLLS